ncbi:GNAT family N-acetyltransferase [Amycolatopsis sp. CA-128772]|uniref:GNAT family N-acetyltransferase n=1 Tax=Amycolatopsis sp. CA-128772 TaxID=2073159 RepID=UPI001E2F1946|nr:GNAT family N-acetyltransferase [Amycolatopsis sp. CA-128772]
MTGGVRIEAVSSGDWPGIVRLETESYAAKGLSERRSVLESRVRASPETCFVLRTGRHLAGYVLALPYPLFRFPAFDRPEGPAYTSGNLHLHDLVIARDRRGRGLAKVLLDRLIVTARSRRYDRMSLIAVAGSTAFWSANGFRPHPEVPVPGYGADAGYLSRAL